MLTTRIRKGEVALATVVACSFLLAGCTMDGKPSASANPYAANYQFAAENATSDFEKDALKDGKISRAEYDEAHQLWLACMEKAYPPGEQPITVRLELGDNGLYQFAADVPATAQDSFDPDFYDEVFDACTQGTTALVAPLFNDDTLNPSGTPLADKIAACLVDSGFVDPGYTGEDASRDYFDKPDGTELNLPPEVQTCLDQATGHSG